jgi:hypothetical protein
MHTPTDVRVSVRELSIEVVNVVPVLASPLPANLNTDPYTLAPATLRSGSEVFVLVCAPVVNHTLTNPGTGTPVVEDATPAAAENPVRLFVGAPNGTVYRVRLDVNDPPEEPVNLTFAATVGVAGAVTAPVTATFPLAPHFRLISGSGNFNAARNAPFTLNTTDNTTPDPNGVTVTPPDGITVSVTGFVITLQVDAGAAVGPRRVLVTKLSEPNVKAVRTITIV